MTPLGPTLEAQFDLAGMSVDRSSPWVLSQAQVPPGLRLDGHVLRYRAGIRPKPADSDGLLDRFLKIEGASDVLAFAKRHGVLGICSTHGLPSTHGPLPRRTDPSRSEESRTAVVPLYQCLPRGWPDVAEPVGRWLHFVTQASALRSIALALHQQKRPSAADWATVLGDLPTADAQAKAKDYAGDTSLSRHVLTAVIDRWLLLGSIRPTLRWLSLDVEPSVELQTGTFGAIAMQLAISVTQKHELKECSGCHQVYAREGRKAQVGRRNYCENCREAKRPQRDAKRAQRERGGHRLGARARRMGKR